MIDIHCHILPNVDDGSKSLDETRDLLNLAMEEGIRDIVITPHFSRVDNYVVKRNTLLSSFNNLKNECNDMNINLYLGNELMIDKDLDELLMNKEVLSLNNSSYVLVEFPFEGYKDDYDDYLMNIELLGYKIIIAHPERYKWVLNNPDKYVDRWINNGYYLQCNGTFVNNYRQKKFVFKLIEKQIVHLIASDGHNINRPVTLNQAYDLIGKRFNTEVSNILFYENPKRVLENKELVIINKVRKHLF